MVDAAPVSGWNGPEGRPSSPMDMSEYIAAKREHPKPSRALTPAPAGPSVDRAKLPSVDGAWHFKGAATKWAAAEPALPMATDDRLPVLSDAQVSQWAAEGYVVIHGLWPQPLIDTAVEQLQATLGAGEEIGGFPYGAKLDALNQIVLHNRILKAAEQCLGTVDLTFSGAGVMHKKHQPAVGGARGERPDFQPGEQGLHQDVRAAYRQRVCRV
jgi:hypothetical protein